jgi:hypothetical protein
MAEAKAWPMRSARRSRHRLAVSSSWWVFAWKLSREQSLDPSLALAVSRLECGERVLAFGTARNCLLELVTIDTTRVAFGG